MLVSTLAIAAKPASSAPPIVYDTTLTGNQSGAAVTQVAPSTTVTRFNAAVDLAGYGCRMNVFVGVTSNPANQVASLTFPSSYLVSNAGLPARFEFVHAGITYSSPGNVFSDSNIQVL